MTELKEVEIFELLELDRGEEKGAPLMVFLTMNDLEAWNKSTGSISFVAVGSSFS